MGAESRYSEEIGEESQGLDFRKQVSVSASHLPTTSTVACFSASPPGRRFGLCCQLAANSPLLPPPSRSFLLSLPLLALAPPVDLAHSTTHRRLKLSAYKAQFELEQLRCACAANLRPKNISSFTALSTHPARNCPCLPPTQITLPRLPSQ